MKIISKYLAGQWIKWFTLSCFVLNSLIFLQLIGDEGINFSSLAAKDLFQKFFYPVLEYQTWLFPISCFLATIFSISSLSKNRELMALDASGVSFFVISKPILLLALLCCSINFLSTDSERITTYIDCSFGWSSNLKHEPVESFQMKLKNENRTWYFNKYDTKQKHANGIFLYSYDEKGNDVYRIKAKSGNYTKDGWEFNHGRFLGFSTDDGTPLLINGDLKWKYLPSPIQDNNRSRSFGPRFKKDFLFLKLDDIRDDPLPYALMRSKPKDMSMSDLNIVFEQFPDKVFREAQPYRLRRAQLFWNTPACLLATFFALAVSLNRKKNSVGLTIGLSIIWISFFYIIKTISDMLGENGILNEWYAVGIPFLLFFLISIFTLWKNR